MHKDDRLIVNALWTVFGTIVVGSMFLGGTMFWSLPYLLGRLF